VVVVVFLGYVPGAGIGRPVVDQTGLSGRYDFTPRVDAGSQWGCAIGKRGVTIPPRPSLPDQELAEQKPDNLIL
jgi:uncharacterized protein (TIGR03435 family)